MVLLVGKHVYVLKYQMFGEIFRVTCYHAQPKFWSWAWINLFSLLWIKSYVLCVAPEVPRPTSRVLSPASFGLGPTSEVLCPTSCILCPPSYDLLPMFSSMRPAPYIPHLTSCILRPTPIWFQGGLKMCNIWKKRKLAEGFIVVCC